MVTFLSFCFKKTLNKFKFCTIVVSDQQFSGCGSPLCSSEYGEGSGSHSKLPMFGRASFHKVKKNTLINLLNLISYFFYKLSDLSASYTLILL